MTLKHFRFFNIAFAIYTSKFIVLSNSIYLLAQNLSITVFREQKADQSKSAFTAYCKNKIYQRRNKTVFLLYSWRVPKPHLPCPHLACLGAGEAATKYDVAGPRAAEYRHLYPEYPI